MTLVLPILLILGYNKEKKKEDKPYFILFWIGVILATGISHPWTAPLFEFLFKYLPFFSGLRDSHKLISLVALSYAFLIPKLSKSRWFKAGIVIFVLFYTFPLIGLSGQMQNVPYPKEYYTLNNYLDNVSGHIIYLPWQTYLTYNWSEGVGSDGRIATPINKIIEADVETGPDSWGSATNFSKQIQSCLNQQSVNCLEEQGVQYIIKDKCASFPTSYPFINESLEYFEGCVELYKLDNDMIVTKKKASPFYIASILLSLFVFLYLLNKART
jgi:hypothetical protein